MLYTSCIRRRNLHVRMFLILYSLLFYIPVGVLGHNNKDNGCHVVIPGDESQNDTIVNYYVNLIDREIEKAENYELPKNSDYFLENPEFESSHIDLGTYDFIIVGGGSAGSALAYGLSEIQDWKIFVIEAGGNETDFSKIPGFYSNLQTSRMNWGYFSTPQEHICGGSENKTCSVARGKVEGGSGAINGLLYVRGNENDYNNWASKGNPGWSYDDVLPYFIKQEHSKINGDPGYHGKNGLLLVEHARPVNPLLSNFLEANKVVGRRTVDYNGVTQLGASRMQFTTLNGRRESGGSVFLTRAKCRRNFHILTNSLVTKVLVDDSKKAYGVEFIRFGRNYTATARKEVILSAGALNSPQLLLLSGIGPKDELAQLGIDVVHDLPGVGRNLCEQISERLTFTTNVTTSSLSREELVRMYLAGVGPYTRSVEAQAFVRLETSNLAPGVPDIQFTYVVMASNLSDTVWQYSFTIILVLLHPKSKGSVTLTTKNPLRFPAIDLNALYEEEDRQTLYGGIEAVFKLIETEPFQRINATFVKPNIPECDQYEYGSRNYWTCHTKYEGYPSLHATSTTAMGIGRNAVVDDRLRVLGIKNLRVVDIGVIPSILSGNTNAPAFMIGSKASDIIKEDVLC